MDDILENKIYYHFNNEDVLINSEFYKLSSSKMEKEHFFTVESGIYLILLDTTLDNELIWKMKLTLWKREIQELRKKLNYQIWDKLELLVDENTLESKESLTKWKEYFEGILNSRVRIVNKLNDESYEFNFEEDKIKYNLNELI